MVKKRVPDIVIARTLGFRVGEPYRKGVQFDSDGRSSCDAAERHESVQSYQSRFASRFRTGLALRPPRSSISAAKSTTSWNASILGSWDHGKNSSRLGVSGDRARSGKAPPLTDPAAFGSYLRSSRLMLRRTSEEVGIKVGECQVIHHEIDADASVFDSVKSRAGELQRSSLATRSYDRGVSMRAAGELEELVRQATGLAKSRHVAAFVEMLVEQGLQIVLFGWHKEVYAVWETI